MDFARNLRGFCVGFARNLILFCLNITAKDINVSLPELYKYRFEGVIFTRRNFHDGLVGDNRFLFLQKRLLNSSPLL